RLELAVCVRASGRLPLRRDRDGSEASAADEDPRAGRDAGALARPMAYGRRLRLLRLAGAGLVGVVFLLLFFFLLLVLWISPQIHPRAAGGRRLDAWREIRVHPDH